MAYNLEWNNMQNLVAVLKLNYWEPLKRSCSKISCRWLAYINDGVHVGDYAGRSPEAQDPPPQRRRCSCS